MRKLLVLMIGVIPFFAICQNVGIGMSDPTSNLHLESTITDEIIIVEDFDDGTFNPPCQSSTITGITDGAESWAFSSAESFLGSSFGYKVHQLFLYLQRSASIYRFHLYH